MKYNLLKLVQKTLAYVDDFNVNAIDETEESEQVVQIVNQVYNDLMTSYPWPHLKAFGNLESTSTNHIMRLPSNVLGVDWIMYDGELIKYISPYDMEVLLKGRDTTLSNVDDNGALNDQDPVYWTSIDDSEIIFDSYDGSLTTTLTQCYFVETVSELTNGTDEPNIPERFHSTLLDGIIAEAFSVMRNDDQKSMIWARKYAKGVANMKRWSRRLNMTETTMPNDYGRKNARGFTVRNVIDAS